MAEQTPKPGWTRVAFGDVVKLNTDRCADPAAAGIERYVGLEHIEPEDLRIRRWGLVAEGTTFTNRFRPGQVLFGKRRAYQRKVAVAEFEGVCSSDIYVFEPKDERLLPELLPFLCQTEAFYAHAVGTSAGSLSPRTNWTQLATYEFALPPLEEQRRIAELLGAMSDICSEVTNLVACLDQLDEAFCGYILQSYRSEGLIPVGELAKFSSGKQIQVTGLPQQPTDHDLIPVYGGNGISGYTKNPLPTVDRMTIVVGRVGQFCGVTHLIEGPVWITDNALYPVYVDPSIDMQFLALCLRGSNLNKGKLGEYLPLITQKVVHAVLVPVPSLEEQHDWVQYHGDISSIRGSVSTRLKLARQLRHRVMNIDMSGR